MTEHHPSRRDLLRQLTPHNFIQPATVLWRIYEIEAVQRYVAFAGRVFDLGCGDGSLTRVTLGTQLDRCILVGLEPDPTDARDASRSGLYQRVHQTGAEAIPEESGAFEMVFTNSVLEHIVDLTPVLAEISRILVPGGTLVATVPSEQFHSCLAQGTVLSSVGRLRGDTTASMIDRRLQHHRYWSVGEWQIALDSAGMEISAMHRYFPRRAVRAWQRLSDFTGGVTFELFGRSSETRTLQRRMKLGFIERVVPASVQATLLNLVLRSSIDFDVGSADEPSGGLLLIARKSGC